jgi:hypothetical protein
MALEDSHLAAKGQDLGAEASLGESVDEQDLEQGANERIDEAEELKPE